MKVFLAMIIMLAGCLMGRSQIQIDVDQLSLEEYPSVFLGDDFQVSNVTFSGDDDQVGMFLGVNSNLGLDLGLVLGSGDVTLATGPSFFEEYGNGGNNSGSGSFGGGNFGDGDTDLEQISGVAANDAAVLEFDFIPLVNQISFDFIFASEEYNEYVCGTVNDAFGFFVSGPGLSGGGVFENDAINIATIPDSNPPVPISINTVNSGNEGALGSSTNCFNLDPFWQDNSVYFVDNSALDTNEQIIEYDGFTVPITSVLELEVGETYHMKIAIADGGDTAFDSAVFIKSSLQAFIWPSVAGLASDLGDTTMIENCLGGSFDIFIDQTLDLDSVSIELVGSAQMGIDFENVDLSIAQIQNGFLNISITPLEDQEIEDQESVSLILNYQDIFGNPQTLQSSLYINDYLSFESELESELLFCGAPELDIDATPFGGISPFDFNWSNTGSNAPIVSVSEDLDLVQVEVTDYCGQSISHEIALIQAELNLIESEVTICSGDSLNVVVEGNPPYEFEFSSDLFSLENNTLYTSEGDYSESVSVSDACGYEESILISVETCTSVEELNPFGEIELVVSESTLVIKAASTLIATEIDIYDLTGRVVASQPWINSETNSVDLNGLATGQYVVSLSSQSGELINEKFFKQ